MKGRTPEYRDDQERSGGIALSKGTYPPGLFSPSNSSSSTLPSLSEVRRHAAGRGGWCLSHRVERTRQHLLWECREGHRWRMSWRRVKTGDWCPTCPAMPASGKRIDPEAERLAKEEGYLSAARFLARKWEGLCHTQVFPGSIGALDLECKEGHRWGGTYHDLREGSWCPKCRQRDGRETARRHRGEMDLADREELSFYAEGIGCVWVGRGPVKLGHRHFFTCEKGHLWEDDQENRLVCSWCPACGLRGTPLGKSRRVR